LTRPLATPEKKKLIASLRLGECVRRTLTGNTGREYLKNSSDVFGELSSMLFGMEFTNQQLATECEDKTELVEIANRTEI
jgi:hypothetical protein